MGCDQSKPKHTGADAKTNGGGGGGGGGVGGGGCITSAPEGHITDNNLRIPAVESLYCLPSVFTPQYTAISTLSDLILILIHMCSFIYNMYILE